MSYAREINEKLSERVHEFCRKYLPGGHAHGLVYLVGNAKGAEGRSMWVGLYHRDGYLPGKWKDAGNDTTIKHGDLLDILVVQKGGYREALAEARKFLGTAPIAPQPAAEHAARRFSAPTDGDASDRAARLYNRADALPGSLGARYLHERAIDVATLSRCPVRYLRSTFYKQDPPEKAAGFDLTKFKSAQFGTAHGYLIPALILGMSDPTGKILAVNRQYLDPAGGKAKVYTPKSMLGPALGNACRMPGRNDGTVIVGEGFETMASIRSELPHVNVDATFTAANLAGYRWTDSTRRLLIAADRDASGTGEHGARTLRDRARAAGLEADYWFAGPACKDFNDLRRAKPGAIAAMFAPILEKAAI